MALIVSQNTSFAYDGQVVLSDVSFCTHAGDYLCIVGENGSGKSTLMKGLLGLVNPTKGKIRLGEGLTRDQIGYLPQQNQTQKDFPASVREVVESGLRGKRLFLNGEDRKRAQENMALLEIDRLSKRSFMELSGGQKQRVLLARALCATKRLLLMDEPTAGLDPLVGREFYRIVEKINREQGITIVMVSHDIPSALQYASHILHLKQTPVFFGTAEEYRQSPVAQRFLGGQEDV